MSELMDVFTPGDRFLTMTPDGQARVWRVMDDGWPALLYPGSPTLPIEETDTPDA